MMYIFLIFLFWGGFVNCSECPNETTVIQNCSESQSIIVGTFKYEITEEDRENADWMICPRVEDDSEWWSVKMFSTSEITNGWYCSRLLAYDSTQMCINSNGTLLVLPQNLPSNQGVIELVFSSPILTTNVTIRYGTTGVYRLNQPNIVVANEGAEFLGLVFIIFYPSTPNVSFFRDGEEYSQMTSIDTTSCIPSESSDTTEVHLFQFMIVERASAGVYTVQASGVAGQFESNITLQVNEVPEPSPSLSLSATPTTFDSPSQSSVSTAIITSTTTTTVGSINTNDSSSSSDLPSTIVWLIVAVGVFFLVAILIILVVVLMLCYYARKHSTTTSHGHLQPEEFNLASDRGSPKTRTDVSKPRLGSTSSERPLTKSGSTPSVNTPSSDGISNYTAVYCSENCTQCGLMLKHKHGDKIHIISEWEEVRLAIVQPLCTDILVFADPSDGVFKEIMSCGIDPLSPDKRNKLRIIVFASVDHFPSNTIGVNGYRVVLVEGSPSNIDTLLTAINKAEFPELKNELRQSKRGEEDTDNGDSLQKQTVELLKQLLSSHNMAVNLQKESVQVQRENLDVNREQAELMEQNMVDVNREQAGLMEQNMVASSETAI